MPTEFYTRAMGKCLSYVATWPIGLAAITGAIALLYYSDKRRPEIGCNRYTRLNQISITLALAGIGALTEEPSTMIVVPLIDWC